MFVPWAKHPGSPHSSTTILSRLLSFETKTPLLSISTPTLSPAWTFVSLSSKPPPFELVCPKEAQYVSHLMMKRLLPGQAECSLSVLAAQGALFSCYKKLLLAHPRKHSLLIQKRGFIKDDMPAWTLLSAGREPSPWPLHISRVCSLGSALAAWHGEDNSFCSFWPPFLTLLWS